MRIWTRGGGRGGGGGQGKREAKGSKEDERQWDNVDKDNKRIGSKGVGGKRGLRSMGRMRIVVEIEGVRGGIDASNLVV
jgi:hypothetical protein